MASPLYQNKAMRSSISTQIKIKADTDTVWNVLTQWNNFSNWNPFITRIHGKLEKGCRLEVELMGLTMQPEVQKVEPGKHFSWLGFTWRKGIFDGEHHFDIKSDGKGNTVFTQSEKFSGILLPVFKLLMLRKTEQGFVTMNEALREEAERVSA